MNKRIIQHTNVYLYLPMVLNLVEVVVVVDHILDIHHIRHIHYIRHNLDNSLQEVHMDWHQVVVHNFVLPKEQVLTLMM